MDNFSTPDAPITDVTISNSGPDVTTSSRLWERTTYSAEYKKQMVDAVHSGMSVKEIAKSAGIQHQQLLAWIGAAQVEEWLKCQK
jgi:transposase-like protein